MTRLTEVLVSEALKPSFARDEIARRVGAAIIDGRLPEGTPIRQQCLADHYSVSRMPVREALRQLEAQGLLACDEHKGMRVASPKPNATEASTIQAERDALHQMLNKADQRADDLAALLFQALPFLTDTPDLVQHGAEALATRIEAAIGGRPLPQAALAPHMASQLSQESLVVNGRRWDCE